VRSDTHVDLPILVRAKFHNRIYGANFTFRTGMIGDVDIPRLERGRVGGVFWSVFMPCPANSSDFGDAAYLALVRWTFQQIELVHRLVDEYSDVLAFAATPGAAMRAHRGGRVASMIGVEGLHQIGNSPAVMRTFHRLGVRYITLTHVCNNRYADGAAAPGGARWGGLSAEGAKMVREMNRLGMMVDLSHVTDETMRDVLEVAKAPVIYSHSSASVLSPADVWLVC